MIKLERQVLISVKLHVINWKDKLLNYTWALNCIVKLEIISVKLHMLNWKLLALNYVCWIENC